MKTEVHEQRGAVLAATLLLLMVLTLLALGASQVTRSHVRMTTAVQGRDTALQSAEAALRAAERLLNDPALTSSPAPCESPRCRIYERFAPDFRTAHQSVSWWNTHAWTYTEDNAWISAPPEPDGDKHKAGRNGQFFIEVLEEIPDSLTLAPTGPPPGRTYYRITATARGNAEAAPIVLQSTFARRFN